MIHSQIKNVYIVFFSLDLYIDEVDLYRLVNVKDIHPSQKIKLNLKLLFSTQHKALDVVS